MIKKSNDYLNQNAFNKQTLKIATLDNQYQLIKTAILDICYITDTLN